MEVKSHFHHTSYQECLLSTQLITDNANFDHLVEVVLASFLPWKVTFPFFSYSSLWKQVTKLSALKGLELSSTTWRDRKLRKLLGIFLYDRFVFSSFISLFGHLFLSVWIQGYLFELGAITHTTLFTFLFPVLQFWLVSALSGWLLCLSDMPPSFGFLSTFLLPGTKRCPRFILCISCLSPTISHFSWDPRFFYWRISETKIWAVGMFVTTVVSLLPVLFSRQSQEMCVCTNPCAYTDL